MKASYSKTYLYARSIFNIIFTFLFLFISAILITFLLVISLGRLQNPIIQYYGIFLGRTILRIAGIKLEIHHVGEKIDRPAIYISNHSSTIDLFIIIGLGLPRVRFVAKYELLYNPLFFILGRLTGQIFIKRQQTEHAVQILRKAYERIKREKLSLYIAPEGTRKHPGKIGPFKKGAFRMAIDLGYPIVPIYFEGARELCPVDSFIVRPGVVKVWFYPPIDTSDWSLETIDQHIEDVRRMYLQWAGVKEDTALSPATGR